jgi:hypothetical protein
LEAEDRVAVEGISLRTSLVLDVRRTDLKTQLPVRLVQNWLFTPLRRLYFE